MSKNQHIEEEVQRTLLLHENEIPQKTDPFFYARLAARIDAEQAAHHLQMPTRWQRWRPLVLAGFVGANIITAALWLNVGSADNTRAQAINAMAEDYALLVDSGDWLSESLGE